jgi:hypothetical protein
MEAIKKEDLQDNNYYKGIHSDTDIARWSTKLDTFVYIALNDKDEYIIKQVKCFDINSVDDTSFIPLFRLTKINTNVVKNNKLEVVI